MNSYSASLSAAPRCTANFDHIARPYRWMEYLAFGPTLWRCRTYFLPELKNCRNALILGDGDGRFTAALLAAYPLLRADAVDSSATMLRLLTQRVHTAAPDASTRLRSHHTDALAYVHGLPEEPRYDLIVTHFFLDCLAQSEVETLTQSVTSHLAPGALWLLSDFRIPAGPMNIPARALVRSLYLTFRILTGLRVKHLPDHAAALRAADFMQTAQRISLAGTLTTELWALREPAYTSHHAVTASTSAHRSAS
jgi:SAM-dependent methyltransferase